LAQHPSEDYEVLLDDMKAKMIFYTTVVDRLTLTPDIEKIPEVNELILQLQKITYKNYMLVFLESVFKSMTYLAWNSYGRVISKAGNKSLSHSSISLIIIPTCLN